MDEGKGSGKEINNEHRPSAEELIEEMSDEVDRWMVAHGHMYRRSDGTYQPNRGSCYVRWNYEKKLLKERYGIEWKTPEEENPGETYD